MNTERNGDYAIVVQAMLGRLPCRRWYTPYPATMVSRIDDNRQVTLIDVNTHVEQTVHNIDQVIALIGWHASIPFMHDAVLSDGRPVYISCAHTCVQTASACSFIVTRTKA
jgi:hypothetical protein